MIARHKHTWPNLIWQPSVAIIFVLLVLFVMGHFASGDVLWAVGAGSLSSSSYIVLGITSLRIQNTKNTKKNEMALTS